MTQENDKKLCFETDHMTIWQKVENTDLSYHVYNSIIIMEFTVLSMHSNRSEEVFKICKTVYRIFSN